VQVDGYSDDVERDIKSADIVLNFSESESFSHTCLEACAFGRPIIATRCGGPEEIVDDGVSGILVPVRDTDAMVAALSSLGNDAAKRVSMGQSGRQIVRQRFSTESFVHGFKRLTAS
jgi:glycosyltransferase involved in cell wall biosynthesis